MVFATALIANILLATAAFAIPNREERLSGRVARRANGELRQSVPKKASNGPADGKKDVEYSTNWTGAVLVATKATYKSVTGTFTVPTPKEPSGGSSSTSYSSSAWVGIDGDTCGSAILQTGLDFTVRGTTVSYDAWYEWFPDYAYDFTGISFSAGDSVTLTVTATSTKAGSATITNNTKGTTVTKSITSTSALCEENAEWIVEDYEEGSSLVPLSNWGTVTFTGASAGTVSGTSVSPSGATLIDLESENGSVISSVSVSGSSVAVTYV